MGGILVTEGISLTNAVYKLAEAQIRIAQALETANHLAVLRAKYDPDMVQGAKQALVEEMEKEIGKQSTPNPEPEVELEFLNKDYDGDQMKAAKAASEYSDNLDRLNYTTIIDRVFGDGGVVLGYLVHKPQ